MDSSDPIELELPVYISQAERDTLHVLQNPLRPAWRALDLREVSSIGYHPAHGALRLDLPLLLGDAGEHDCEGDDDVESSKLTLEGVPISINEPHCIGYVGNVDGSLALVLHPLASQILLSTHAHHLDKKKENGRTEKAGTDRPNENRLLDVASFQHSQEVTLTHFSEETKASRGIYERLAHLPASLDPLDFQDAKHYLENFSASRITHLAKRQQLSAKLTNRVALKRRIEWVISELKCVTFDLVFRNVSRADDATAINVYSELTTVSHFVQGWFVVMSRYVVEKSLVPYRDYLLLLLALGSEGLSAPSSRLSQVLQTGYDADQQIITDVLHGIRKREVPIIPRFAFTCETRLPPDVVLTLFEEFLIKRTTTNSEEYWALRRQPAVDFLEQQGAWAEVEVRKWVERAQAIVDAMNDARRLALLRELQDAGGIPEILRDVRELPLETCEALYAKYRIE
ncbi:Sin-like protein [Giardia muris]|uniref:Sin-like protein n=1 Tax=Giardia muris TaxID=5742 RepID=A0A4Z1SMR6_GIAMU|nr:Sin-like protein [Giardia muris]|eukprot:TNJ26994.1 Sin-like protein [Giardia muris]